ncbi:MAG: ATP-binding protein [Proteobacteria bacterium]|nr:ATP-binding protein [Pseudomonadota bacterium]
MPTVHLICGPTGAGKTTFARELAAERGALRFSIDEWMANLFAADTPDPLTFEWAIERVGRCETQIWQTGLAALAAGRDIVLDLGFTTREQRDRFRTQAVEASYNVSLHHVTAARDLRLDRVRTRNHDRSEVFAFEVTDGMFEFMEDRFELPAEEEEAVERRSG